MIFLEKDCYLENKNKLLLRAIDLNNIDVLNQCAEWMSTSEPWLTLRRSKEDCLAIFKSPAFEKYLAYQENEMIGIAILSMTGQFTGYIKSILIAPHIRGRGFGKNFLLQLEKIIFNTHPNVFLCVSSFNPRAKKFYLSLGYEEIGEIKHFVIQGHSEFLLRKTIAPLKDFKQTLV
jgi:ribosomal protein S18 acetylase RimI-like enzyme